MGINISRLVFKWAMRLGYLVTCGGWGELAWISEGVRIQGIALRIQFIFQNFHHGCKHQNVSTYQCLKDVYDVVG